ncbi:MAG: hypothetical protein WC383_16940 [Gammaproteobacteria bacterium]
MILIEKTEVIGFDQTIRGMRNPMNSWDKSDSGICKGGDCGIGCTNCASSYLTPGESTCGHTYDHSFQIGKNDYELMMKLVIGGPVHAKFRRMIVVYVDITAPLYWWKEFDTYKVGTVANSCSTMHKIHDKEFTLDDFSHEHLIVEDDVNYIDMVGWLRKQIDILNEWRLTYLDVKDSPVSSKSAKKYWWQMIQLLPSSYNQKRTIMLNYEVLVGIYKHRKNHKLDEWREFCQWIEGLPWSEIIICNRIKEEMI